VKVLIVGAGPAGLYLGYLLKRHRPAWQIRIVEQNPPEATFGFGVVFSDRALEFLREDDAATYRAIVPAMEQWTDLAVVHAGRRITIDGIGFAAIGRLALLRLLQERAASAGLTPEYERSIAAAADLDGYDLVVGADGVNSFVRRYGGDFGTTVTLCTNRFAWYGTTKRFPALTQTFVRAEHGTFTAHHYRYAPDMSTFLVECDEATWRRAGLADMDETASLRYCERVFAGTLAGRPLVSNKSIWRSFPKVWNERWSAGTRVLVGDALRTAHYSIGSGTRLAMEDVIALARALREQPRDVREALALFEAGRRPVVEKLVAAADASAEWYEHFPEHMRLDPWDFAWSYVQRSGRIDPEKLRTLAPRFVAAYEASRRPGRG
jgi:2-polyprenyl-6-methoxyphenol hydroxylase-like FAD-dependent oxidoreductase